MSRINELIKSCEELKVFYSVLKGQKATDYIRFVLDGFRPIKTTGHLSIGHSSVSINLEKYEFSFSEYLDDENGCIFFDQMSDDKDKVFIVDNAQLICKVMENSYGMEYFVSNRRGDYLLSINWYAIEGAGSAKQWLTNL